MNVKRIGLLAALLACSAFGQDGPCDDEPHDGARICYWDKERKLKASETQFVDGKEISYRRWRQDGSLEEVSHSKPNLKEYTTRELYYETGGIRRADFSSPNSNVMIHFTVSGRIHKISCLPGEKPGYAYTVKECQPKVSFDLKSWRPGK